jgi:putative Holliday junction resolvase
MTRQPPPGRIAGIDYGTVRIGVAITDPERKFASPVATYVRRDAEADAAYFRRFAEEHQLVRFVVGLPVHLDGRESQKSAEARQFGVWLGEVTGVGIDFFDERFTSVEAEQYLSTHSLTSKKRKARRDMLAAQIMLTAYLEAGCQGQAEPGAL